MTQERPKTYSELQEAEKDKYKRLNEQGDFVEQSAVENPGVAHRIAHYENEAFGDLETSITQRGISVQELIEKLSGKRLPYDERSELQEMLFESADLQRLKGDPIDDKIAEALEKSYTSFRYSKVLEEKLVEGVGVGDTSVIGELLKDQKFGADYQIIYKLTTDDQRKEAFTICKERLKSACAIIDKVEDTDLALAMYTEVLTLVNPKSYSDESAVESSGARLANKLFEAGATERLVDLVKSETLQLSHCRNFIHRLDDVPQTIVNLTINARKAEDIYDALKFVTDQKLLSQLGNDVKRFTNLADRQRSAVGEYCMNIAKALTEDPKVIALSELNEDEEADYSDERQPKNKFVVGISRGKYVIAWSNMDVAEYHRNIFEQIGHAEAKSGGYIGMREEDGKTIIRMVRSSGDYKYYSRTLLEHYRNAIEESLKEVFGERPFELIIKTSADYE